MSETWNFNAKLRCVCADDGNRRGTEKVSAHEVETIYYLVCMSRTRSGIPIVSYKGNMPARVY